MPLRGAIAMQMTSDTFDSQFTATLPHLPQSEATQAFMSTIRQEHHGYRQAVKSINLETFALHQHYRSIAKRETHLDVDEDAGNHAADLAAEYRKASDRAQMALDLYEEVCDRPVEEIVLIMC